jgi:phosphoribosylglycinamide formyltransferase-1
MVSLVEAMQAGSVDAVPAVVISNQPEAKGVVRSATLGVSCEVVCRDQFLNHREFECKIIEILTRYQIDWIALAGYMAILGPIVLSEYSDRIINIHPSLLPAFKGLDAQYQALNYGVKYAGCTVHYVTKDIDGGAIIDQCIVDVKGTDTVETLSARILVAEHQLYPKALQSVIKLTK